MPRPFSRPFKIAEDKLWPLALGLLLLILSACMVQGAFGRPLPTWTQTIFAFCLLVLAPLVGFLGVLHPLQGFMWGAGRVLLALVASGIVAIALFPGYPQDFAIPEYVAVLFSLPALLAGMYVVWYTRMSDKRIRIFSLLVLAVYLGGVWFSYHFATWSYRKGLPFFTSYVREYAWQDGFLPDYAYYLKAGISESEFEDYVECFDLEPRGKSYWSGPHSDVTWWNIAHTRHETYGKAEDQWEMIATYADGFIYVYAHEW